MLKNIEVFDKLSLRFNGRILFIKDIAGDEICVWSFYGKQRKMAEICCTSIVYATDKKQTKVRGFYRYNVANFVFKFCYLCKLGEWQQGYLLIRTTDIRGS